jgi:superfamily II DNA or RNA helicase
VNDPTRYGRDRRRRPTVEDRRLAYVRAEGRCQNCGKDLPSDYHNAHMAAWTNGGSSDGENIQAECPTCNLKLGSRDAEHVEGLQLRQWQAQALPVILRQLWTSGVATLHAAPGAGKTLFAGAVFQKLRDAGFVDRLIVVVPNTAIVEQWRDALGKLRIYIDTEPRDGFLEHQETAGAVITYHRLPRPSVAAAHATRISKIPTLVILDEVHHVADNAAWGTAVQRMIGDVANGTVHPVGVLNMTGTLFRSSKSKRISTVRYQRVTTDEGEKWQAVADWSKGTASLIGVELRPPDLYAYGAHAELVDLRDEQVISGEIADLDHQQVSAVIRNALTSKEWLKGFVTAAVRMLRNQLEALDGEEPLKLLFVANGRREARLAADAINAVTGQNDFARLIVSDEPQALRTLRRAVREPHSCAIVAVRMITEGFDCPQVSTIAYATNVIADLFVAQTMARAMRITSTERANERLMPAQILIPDHAEIRRAFASALAGALHTVADDPEERLLPSSPSDSPRLPRYELLDLSDPRLDNATVLDQEDGQVPGDQLQWGFEVCRDVGIPEPWVPRFVVGARRYRPPLRTYSRETEPASDMAAGPAPASQSKVTVTELDPRSINRVHRSRLQRASGWMQKHIDHDSRYADVRAFQALANDAAHPPIPAGGRDQALSGQLAEAAQWMVDRIAEHCEAHKEPAPTWLRGGDA